VHPVMPQRPVNGLPDHERRLERQEAAARYDLDEVLELLADAFVALRQALNDLVDEHLHLAPRPDSVDRLCRRALYRAGG